MLNKLVLIAAVFSYNRGLIRALTLLAGEAIKIGQRLGVDESLEDRCRVVEFARPRIKLTVGVPARQRRSQVYR